MTLKITPTFMLNVFKEKLEDNIPFSFTKFGDGEIICILKFYREGATNCDKQSYSEKLSIKLIESLNFYSRNDNVYIGEWNFKDYYDSSFKDFLIKKDIKLNFVPYITLLHIQGADIIKLKSFYEALSKKSNKVYICPPKLNVVKSFLNCEILNIKKNEAFSEYEKVKEHLLNQNYDIYLYSCGLMSKVLIADILKEKPNTTHIDIGSGLDNLLDITRSYQLSPNEMKNIYKI
jgi:hypothetical protein